MYNCCVLCVGLLSSDTYMKIAKEQEMERQTRRNKKAAKQRTSKSGKRRKHVADDEPEDDIPVMHVVSTTIDAPEVPAVVARSTIIIIIIIVTVDWCYVITYSLALASASRDDVSTCGSPRGHS